MRHVADGGEAKYTNGVRGVVQLGIHVAVHSDFLAGVVESQGSRW